MRVSIDINPALKYIDQLEREIVRASQIAVVEAAYAVALPAMRQSLSHSGGPAPVGRLGMRTGRLFSQLKVKPFRQRNGLWGAVVKVIGDRAFIANIHEKGAASHGRRPSIIPRRGVSKTRQRFIAAALGTSVLPARKMFTITGEQMRLAIEAKMLQAFESALQQKL